MACGLARNFEELFAARMAVGVGEAGLVPLASSLIADYFAPARRAKAFGLFVTVSLSPAVGHLADARRRLLRLRPFGRGHPALRARRVPPRREAHCSGGYADTTVIATPLDTATTSVTALEDRLRALLGDGVASDGSVVGDGDRWIALNAKVAHSEARALVDDVEALIARHKPALDAHKVEVSRLLTVISNHAFSYEPVFNWHDAWLPMIPSSAISAGAQGAPPRPERQLPHLPAHRPPHGIPDVAALPAETHDHCEEMFMIHGEMYAPEGTMGAGAYFFRPPHIVHRPHMSETGFLQILRSPGASRIVTHWSDMLRPLPIDAAFAPVMPEGTPAEQRSAWVPEERF